MERKGLGVAEEKPVRANRPCDMPCVQHPRSGSAAEPWGRRPADVTSRPVPPQPEEGGSRRLKSQPIPPVQSCWEVKCSEGGMTHRLGRALYTHANPAP